MHSTSITTINNFKLNKPVIADIAELRILLLSELLQTTV